MVSSPVGPSIIDLHTHVFNLKYLPIAGILRRFGAPRWLAEAVAYLLLAITDSDVSLDAPRKADLPSVESAARRLAEEAPRDLFLSEVFLAGLEYLDDADLAAGGFETSEIARLRSARMDGTAAFVTELRRLHPHTWSAERRRGIIERLLTKLLKVIRKAPFFLRFLYLLTRDERTIVRTLEGLYGKHVSVFVHHLMDLECHYGDAPRYPYVPTQIQRMRKLTEWSNGRLVGFAAYDPFRDNCLDIVEFGLKNGCIGVKFYPPSGYRPTQNVPYGHGGPPPEVIDQRNHDLFKRCVRDSVPIFAHCNEKGFEAWEDAGLNSDPIYWRAVVKTPGLEKLRLCLGHAGGESGWFQPNTPGGDSAFEKGFEGRAYDLAVEAPNVYCEFGYLDEIVNSEGLRRFRTRLEKLVTAKPKFAQRIIYGSDWHMLYQESSAENYLSAFDRVFTDGLDDLREPFFWQNAVEYLGRDVTAPLGATESPGAPSDADTTAAKVDSGAAGGA